MNFITWEKEMILKLVKTERNNEDLSIKEKAILNSIISKLSK